MNWMTIVGWIYKLYLKLLQYSQVAVMLETKIDAKEDKGRVLKHDELREYHSC